MTARRSRVGGWPIAIVGMVLVLLAYTLRYTLVPFVFAAMIGFVLDPVLEWSARRLAGRRWPMAVLLSLLIVAGAGLGVWWIGTTAFVDGARVVNRLPQMIRDATRSLVGPGGIDVFGLHYTPQQVSSMVIDGATHMLDVAQVLLAVKIGAGAAAGFILTLVLIPYFLVSGPRLASGSLWLIPPERRRSVEAMLPELVPLLRRYIVGLICVVIYTVVAAYIALGVIFHVTAAALLAVVVGCLELIPVIGPITSLVLIGLTAAQQDLFGAIVLMGYALALRLSIDNLVGPFALGRAVTVHPVVVIFGFVVGAMLFGIIGLVLAVPTAACIKLILERYYAEPIMSESTPGGQ
jgi:predicted PurR-regulated permease PerM